PVVLVTPDKEQTAFNHEQNLVKLIGEKPAAAVTDRRVRAAENGRFGVEVRIDDRPVQPILRGGFAYVPLEKGTVFTLQLFNPCAHEVVASVCVDGLDICEYPGAEKPGKGLWLIPPGKSIPIRGWCKSLKQSAEFLVTE